MLSRADFMNFMTSKSSLTAEKIGRDLISRLSFSFRAWILRAWLMKEYNLAYDLWAALREQDSTTKFAGIFGLDWIVCCADFLYQQNTLLSVFDELGRYTSFLTYKHGTTNWYDDICDKTDIRCADSGLGAKWSFRHFFTSDYCSWTSIFYGFPTFLLVATFLENDYHSITSTCEPGLSMDFSFLGHSWIWDGIAGVSVGIFGHGVGNSGSKVVGERTRSSSHYFPQVSLRKSRSLVDVDGRGLMV